MNKQDQRRQDKQKFMQIIGTNLRIAREINGYSRKQVMQEVFGGDGKNLNRISEIEHGNLLPPIVTIAKLANMYNVSLDFIFGRVSEPDLMAEDAYVSRAVGIIRNLGLDMMDGLTKVLIEQAKSLPKSDDIALMESSKNLIQAILKDKNSILKNHNHLRPLLNDLNNALVQSERAFAKKQVLFNIAYDDAISEQCERQHKNRLLVEKIDREMTKNQLKMTKKLNQPKLF